MVLGRAEAADDDVGDRGKDRADDANDDGHWIQGHAARE